MGTARTADASRRRAIAAGAAIGTGLLARGGASAQGTFPSREVRLVVPYPPGASTDNLSRAFGRELARLAGQPVVVENKPGGNTAIATMAVKAAPADGHALLLQTEAYWTAKLSTPGLGYEVADLEIAVALAQTPYVLIAAARPGLATLDDLKAVAARSGELTFGTLTAGTSLYSILSGRVAAHLGVPHRLIPYKGGVEGVSAVMAGDIDGYFATVALAHTLKDNPRVRLLGVTSAPGVNPFLPGVKPFAELGVPDMEFRAILVLMARAGTPPDVRQRLERLLADAAGTDEMRRARAALSLEEFPGTLADARAAMARIVEAHRRAAAAEAGR